MNVRPESKPLRVPDACLPKIQNVVGTVNLGCKLDLKEITWKGKATEYNPNRFAAVIMRLRNPKTTGLIFSSGKMVITGARSEEECQLASRKYAKIIEKMGFAVRYSDFKIQNVVASADVKFPIHLEKLEIDHISRKVDTSEIQFMPELFPGLVYRLKNPKMAFLIFVSGKIVITGAKSFREILESFEQMYRLVHRFRKLQHN
jgi:transcription initiation factor TFIID TATA-box-binding protein